MILTEAGAYPQLPTQPNFFYPFQTYTATYYGHSELPGEEKSKGLDHLAHSWGGLGSFVGSQ